MAGMKRYEFGLALALQIGLVSEGASGRDAEEALRANGITTSSSNANYRGNDVITRAEAATMFMRASGQSPANVSDGLQRAVTAGLYGSAGDGSAEFKEEWFDGVASKGNFKSYDSSVGNATGSPAPVAPRTPVAATPAPRPTAPAVSDSIIKNAYMRYIGAPPTNDQIQYWKNKGINQGAVENGIKTSTRGQAYSQEIKGWYEKYLGRSPSATEVDKQQARGIDRNGLESAIRTGPEYQQLVRNAYSDLIGEAPSSDNISFWVNKNISLEDMRGQIANSTRGRAYAESGSVGEPVSTSVRDYVGTLAADTGFSEETVESYILDGGLSTEQIMGIADKAKEAGMTNDDGSIDQVRVDETLNYVGQLDRNRIADEAAAARATTAKPGRHDPHPPSGLPDGPIPWNTGLDDGTIPTPRPSDPAPAARPTISAEQETEWLHELEDRGLGDSPMADSIRSMSETNDEIYMLETKVALEGKDVERINEERDNSYTREKEIDKNIIALEQQMDEVKTFDLKISIGRAIEVEKEKLDAVHLNNGEISRKRIIELREYDQAVANLEAAGGTVQGDSDDRSVKIASANLHAAVSDNMEALSSMNNQSGIERREDKFASKTPTVAGSDSSDYAPEDNTLGRGGRGSTFVAGNGGLGNMSLTGGAQAGAVSVSSTSNGVPKDRFNT